MLDRLGAVFVCMCVCMLGCGCVDVYKYVYIHMQGSTVRSGGSEVDRVLVG